MHGPSKPWWEHPASTPNAGPAVPWPPTTQHTTIPIPAALNDEQHTEIERLAGRCPHQTEPCQACTNLAVGAVTALVECGWWAQIDHYRNRPNPQEQP